MKKRRRKRELSPKEIQRGIERRAWSKTTRKRKPEDWLELVEEIQDKALRVAVAGIVWWDYFGAREVLKRWPHLDAILEDWRDAKGVNPGRVIAALKKLGWPKFLAEKRVASMYEREEGNGYE